MSVSEILHMRDTSSQMVQLCTATLQLLIFANFDPIQIGTWGLSNVLLEGFFLLCQLLAISYQVLQLYKTRSDLLTNRGERVKSVLKFWCRIHMEFVIKSMENEKKPWKWFSKKELAPHFQDIHIRAWRVYQTLQLQKDWRENMCEHAIWIEKKLCAKQTLWNETPCAIDRCVFGKPSPYCSIPSFGL